MRCTILAIGSRGDVQPLIALGAALRAAGHAVRLATHGDFAGDVQAHGMEFYPLTGNAARFFGGPAARVLRDRTRNARAFAGFFDNYLDLFFQKLLAGCWEASRDAEAIFCWSWLVGIGPALAARLQIPVFLVASYPVDFPTAAFPNPFHGELAASAPAEETTPEANLASWHAFAETALVGYATRQRWRQETLGLPACSWQDEVAQTQQMPHLFAYSPLVLPKPPEWPAWAHVTGYWMLDASQDYTPTAEVAAFLARYPRPVALGFSSQVGRSAARMTALTIAALRQLEQPAILIAGFGGLHAERDAGELPAYVLPVRAIPYDWLFAHTAAMVHQGGAGSVAMTLRAGVPSLAVAFGYDQAMWGQRIAAVGAGLPPIAADALTADNLAEALHRLCTDEALRHNARAIAARLQQEDGLANAVHAFEATVRQQTGAHPV